MKIDSLLRPPPRYLPIAICVVISILLLAAASIFTYQHYARSMAIKAQLERIHASRNKVVSAVGETIDSETRTRWKAIRSEAAFSWYPIFRALEDANSSNIELLEFSPDKASRRAVIRGEARDQSALTSYLAALSAQAAFRELHLAHQKVVRKSGMDTIAFEIRAAFLD